MGQEREAVFSVWPLGGAKDTALFKQGQEGKGYARGPLSQRMQLGQWGKGGSVQAGPKVKSGLRKSSLTCRKVWARTRKCSCKLRLSCRWIGPSSQRSLKHSASGHFWEERGSLNLEFCPVRTQTGAQRWGPDLIPRATYQDLRPRGRALAWSFTSLQLVLLGTLGIQLEEERDG